MIEQRTPDDEQQQQIKNYGGVKSLYHFLVRILNLIENLILECLKPYKDLPPRILYGNHSGGMGRLPMNGPYNIVVW